MKPKAQSPKPKAQSPKPKAQSPKPKAQSPKLNAETLFFLFFFFAFSFFGLFPSKTQAQTGNRTHFTFHIYVDPIYGDDSLALVQNPDPLVINHRPLMDHPKDPVFIKGALQQAPYSFQTVGGALTWIGKFPFTSMGSGRRLPWTNPDLPTKPRTIDYIVIHCLPGLYGPTINAQKAIDPYSGLRWNGESFPLDIPQRVSIQGTSALDTIFDARSKEGAPKTSIFHIGYPNPDKGHKFEFTFIDGVTIRGARGTATKSTTSPRNGAGVLIDMEAEVGATISNCVITDNVVGIGVWKDTLDHQHWPIIVNNTFAWNQIGIWNGSSVQTPSVGVSKLRVFNNIFDSSTPATLSNYMVGISDFEGLDSQDRIIVSRNNQTLSVDANAYEVTSPPSSLRTNLGDTLTNPPLLWPRTLTRNGATNQTYLPRYNLVPITQPAPNYGNGSSNRKTLYINDLFLRLITPLNTRISFHDFRLAPMAEDIVKPIPNPLINLGLDFGVSPVTGKTLHTGNLLFQNGMAILYSPGLPPASVSSGPEDQAQLNAWDWDCNGFGNRRVADRRGATQKPSTPADSRIDLGASECLELTISGYLTNTRIFSKAHSNVASNTGNFPSNANLWFFNIPATLGDGSLDYNFMRPWCNYQVDLKQSYKLNNIPIYRLPGSEWFNQALTNPYKTVLGSAGNYTDGRFDTRPSGNNLASDQTKNLRFWLETTVFNQLPRRHLPPFMRNLSCDIAPHLAFDTPPHPSSPNTWYAWWGERFRFARPNIPPFPTFTPIPDYDDIFKSNPWFQNPSMADTRWTDNSQLYYQAGTKVIKDGHINPPLTLPQGSLPPSVKSFLLLNNRHGWIWYEFGPLPQVYTVNTRGYTQQPDSLPALQNNAWHGTRFNCELILPDDPYWQTRGVPHNNLQTFLVVNELTGTTNILETAPGSNLKPDKNLGLFGKARTLATNYLGEKARIILQKKKIGKKR